MVNNILNKERAEALFNSKAIFINSSDVIEEKEAVDVLGKKAFKYAVNHTKGALNSYWIGDYGLYYMTKRAFFTGVTYRNVELAAQNAKNL